MDESLERWGYVLESRGMIASRSQTETGVNSEGYRTRGLNNWGQKKKSHGQCTREVRLQECRQGGVGGGRVSGGFLTEHYIKLWHCKKRLCLGSALFPHFTAVLCLLLTTRGHTFSSPSLHSATSCPTGSEYANGAAASSTHT